MSFQEIKRCTVGVPGGSGDHQPIALAIALGIFAGIYELLDHFLIVETHKLAYGRVGSALEEDLVGTAFQRDIDVVVSVSGKAAQLGFEVHLPHCLGTLQVLFGEPRKHLDAVYAQIVQHPGQTQLLFCRENDVRRLLGLTKGVVLNLDFLRNA